jgi:toxin-antitoxin system PIN domain toxin
VILLDANILMYLYNADAPEHRAASAWFAGVLADRETIGLPLPAIWAFVRLTTNRGWLHPIPAEQAFQIIRDLLGHPGVVLVESGSRHLAILEKLVTDYDVSGPRISDAVLAAIALEHGASLASADRDFRRFESLRWINPLAAHSR